jgi:hypothetical protein
MPNHPFDRLSLLEHRKNQGNHARFLAKSRLGQLSTLIDFS